MVEVDLPYLAERMRQTIASRRVEPRDDAISYLLAQEVEGRPITEDEVFSMVDLLVAGGTVTTANLVSQSLVWLYQHQDVRQRLIDEPELMDRAVEEFLRYFAPQPGARPHDREGRRVPRLRHEGRRPCAARVGVCESRRGRRL